MKQIHTLWHNDQIPVHEYSKSWQQMNPDANFRMWTFCDVEKVMSKNLPEMLDVYDSMPFLLQRANLLRIILVEQSGGIYHDLDVECLKPLDDLFARELVFGYVNDRVISNAVIGAARPGNPFWRAMLDRIASVNQRIQHDTDGIKSSGAELLTTFINEHGYAHHALSKAALYDRRGYTFHHAGRPAWVGKQFIDGQLYENRSDYAIA